MTYLSKEESYKASSEWEYGKRGYVKINVELKGEITKDELIEQFDFLLGAFGYSQGEKDE